MFKSRVATALIFQGQAERSRKKRGRPPTQPQALQKKRAPPHSVSLERRFDGGAHFPPKKLRVPMRTVAGMETAEARPGLPVKPVRFPCAQNA